ncbi:MAG: hypothetical protein JST68_18620 [Bacteroidetes bacterium]|nr:hypothetical protein [Bacteroidota bacterium]
MNKYIVFLSLVLVSCAATREWKSNDTAQGSSASFALFNGRAEYPVSGSTNSRFYVKFDVGVEKGSLGVILQSATGVVKDTTISSGWTDSLVIDNPGRQGYKVKLRGQQAAGHFTVRSGGL